MTDEMFSLILSIVGLVLALYSLGLSARNAWVFERRTELNRFENGVHVTSSYADYDTMMRKFWIWDVEKFKLPNACGEPGLTEPGKQPYAKRETK